MFGKLTLDAVPYHEPIIVVTVAAIIIGGLALLAAITYFGKWALPMERVADFCRPQTSRYHVRYRGNRHAAAWLC